MAANVLITPCLTGRIAWKAHKSRIGWIRRVHIAPEKSEAGRTIIGPCDPTFALTTWLVGQRPQPTEGEDGDDQERVEQEQRPKNPAFILIEKCVRERTGNESLFEDESDPENGCGLPPKLGVPRTPQPLGQARCLRLRIGRQIRSRKGRQA